MTRPRDRRAHLVVLVALVCSLAPQAAAQDEPPGGTPLVKELRGAARILRVPGAGTGKAESRAATEIFPDSDKVWMHVHGADPRPVEAARRGARSWVCSGGCELDLPEGEGPGGVADAMLQSIKISTPVQPLPITIWQRRHGDPEGRLRFDPVLLGRRNYDHVCAYPPVSAKGKPGDAVEPCKPPKQPSPPAPTDAEMTLGLQWPADNEFAQFEYLAITDTCGNAHVQPFQRTFTVPVFHVATGGCGKADGRVLRVFPGGGWVRVTAFNLDAPAGGNVVSATFRVTLPALEDVVSADTPPLLFPDPRPDQIVIDCGPELIKARPGEGGMPRPPSGSAPPGVPPGKGPGSAPPGKGPGAMPASAPPDAPPPPATPPPAAPEEEPMDHDAAEKGGVEPPKQPPILTGPRTLPASDPVGQPLMHQGLVIAPEPLLRGNCRLEFRSQTRNRLVAPLALRVLILRTDKESVPRLLDETWVITPTDYIFRIPPLGGADFDGESRLRLEVYSDPLGAEGNVVLLSDAPRLSRIDNPDSLAPEQAQRLIGSVTIHSAPLCGESNFETVEAAGSCLRVYFTVPVMLATLQVTRAPWIERPLVTRAILSAVGVALAFDMYDPVERSAFPIALQLGGFVQDLEDDRIGLMGYVGIAPTIPILGEGGNTTNIGVLGGLGMEYITRQNGPDEGFKPAAFLSIIVQIGQANPAVMASGGEREFVGGSYEPRPLPSGTR
jgi:hypothetical protein